MFCWTSPGVKGRFLRDYLWWSSAVRTCLCTADRKFTQQWESWCKEATLQESTYTPSHWNNLHWHMTHSQTTAKAAVHAYTLTINKPRTISLFRMRFWHVFFVFVCLSKAEMSPFYCWKQGALNFHLKWCVYSLGENHKSIMTYSSLVFPYSEPLSGAVSKVSVTFVSGLLPVPLRAIFPINLQHSRIFQTDL